LFSHVLSPCSCYCFLPFRFLSLISFVFSSFFSLFHSSLFLPLALVCLLNIQLTKINHIPGDDLSVSHNTQ
jgi:hypothetical protein